jgi:DnaK suppressor protein
MKKSDLNDFRDYLQNWHDQLLRDADDTLNDLLNSAQPTEADPVDRASSEVERNFNLRIRDRESKLIKKIRGTLARIDKGTFGICDGCGEEIGLKRLQARPVTNYCIKCKEATESRERVTGR